MNAVLNRSRDVTQEEASRVWHEVGETGPLEDPVTEPFYQMLAEKRRLEDIAARADKAVLRQNLKIWQKYQVYAENERRKLAKRESNNKVADEEITPASVASAIRSVLNGHGMTLDDVVVSIRKRFPKLVFGRTAVKSGLQNLRQGRQCFFIQQGERYLHYSEPPTSTPLEQGDD